jgi:hypothetical protein
MTSASETWTLSVRDIKNLLVSERQILRKISGPVRCKEGWRIRSNKELQTLIKGEEIVTYTERSTNNKMVGTSKQNGRYKTSSDHDWNPKGISTKGRPKNRWRYEVINDFKKLKLRNWMQLVKDRKAWNDLAQKTKTHEGMQRLKKKNKNQMAFRRIQSTVSTKLIPTLDQFDRPHGAMTTGHTTTHCSTK